MTPGQRVAIVLFVFLFTCLGFWHGMSRCDRLNASAAVVEEPLAAERDRDGWYEFSKRDMLDAIDDLRRRVVRLERLVE